LFWSALNSWPSSPDTGTHDQRPRGHTAIGTASPAGRGNPIASAAPSGRLLDAEAEHLGSAAVKALETEGLIARRRGSRWLLTYPVSPHRMSPRTDVPEFAHNRRGWIVLDDPGLSAKEASRRVAEDAAEEERGRRLRHPIALPTSTAGNIAPAIVERSCPPRRVSCPNERARRADNRIYRRSALNDRQIEIIRRGPTPKRDYYCQSRAPANRPVRAGPLSRSHLLLRRSLSRQEPAAIERVLASTAAGRISPGLAPRAPKTAWAGRSIPETKNKPANLETAIMIKRAHMAAAKRRRAIPGHRCTAHASAQWMSTIRPTFARTC